MAATINESLFMDDNENAYFSSQSVSIYLGAGG